MTNEPNTLPFFSGYVSLIGAPNVGKSTLMNHFIGEKLSIVTHKPQTTRKQILGIYSDETHQIIFQDTPGYLNPEYLLHEKMLGYAKNSIENSNLILLMVDATKPEPFNNEFLAQHVNENPNIPVFLVINKIDEVASPRIEKLAVEHAALFPQIKQIHKISAEKGIQTASLLEAIKKELPQHEPYFPVDDLSTHSVRFFVEEIIREKIFLLFEKEIPYSTAVHVTDYQERENSADYIDAEIIVERATQKIIVVGKGGAKIKELGQKSREDIEKLVGKPVYLHLFVKVRDQWRKKNNFLSSFGYE